MKKMSLFTVLCLCIGTIIGAGIFGSLPSAALLAGPAMIIVCLVAGFEILVRYLPAMVPATSIPASNGFYMYLSRLVHPYIGFLQMLQVLFNVFVLSLLASIFSRYFNMIVSANSMLVALLVILVFGVIAYFGIRTGAKVNNIMVVILLLSLGLFAVLGIPAVKPEYFTISAAFSMKGLTFTSFGAALGLVSSCLTGGYVSVNYSEDMENPKRNVMMSFVLSTIIVAIIYMLLSVVTVGVAPLDESTSLASLAQMFMPAGAYWFFLVGGALFALCTTIIGCIMSGINNLSIIARDRVLPDLFNKKNKYGTSPACLVLICGAAMLIVAFSLPISTLMSVSSVLGILVAVAQFIPPLRLPKKYPHCYKHASIKFPKPVLYASIAIAACFCVYEVYSLIVTSAGAVWLALLATLVIAYAYFFLRISYLKKKGVDLIAIMSAPYSPWEEKEAEYAAMDAGKE